MSPEKVFIGVIIFGYPCAEFGMGRAAADKNLFVVHGDILHGKHRLAPETTDDKIDPIS